MNVQKILQEYLATKDIAKVISFAELSNSAFLYCIAGTHYMTTELNDELVEKYMLQSLNIEILPMCAYNLAYFYESKIRSLGNSLPNKEEYETKMIKYYEIAISYHSYEAHNQLGYYFINEPDRIFLGKTPLELLEIAANKDILPAVNNLLNYYKNKNDIDKIIDLFEKKYLITSDTLVLMDFILAMLNGKRYKKYFVYFDKYRKGHY